MNDLNEQHRPLYGLQRFMWFLFAVAYAVATLLYVMKSSIAEAFMMGTTLTLLVLTGAKLVLIGAAFYQRGLKRHLVVTILLLLVLASVAIAEMIK